MEDGQPRSAATSSGRLRWELSTPLLIERVEPSSFVAEGSPLCLSI